MKKFLTVLLIFGNLFFASTVNAETETYTGKGKATMGESETQEQIIERAKTYALRNAREKAGVYIKTKSRLKDFELVEDDIITLASGVLKITDTQIEKTLVNDTIQVFVTVTVIIDMDNLQKEIDDFLAQRGIQESAKTQIPADAVKFNYNGHSYKLIDMGLTWAAAKTYCESLGGHLVTITSGVEQAFVQDLIVNRGTKGYYWTGGVRNSAGDFVWITGEKFSYSNWGSGEPNNSGGSENVIALYRHGLGKGSWNDLSELGSDADIIYNQQGHNVFWKDFNGGLYTFFDVKNSGFICEWDS